MLLITVRFRSGSDVTFKIEEREWMEMRDFFERSEEVVSYSVWNGYGRYEVKR